MLLKSIPVQIIGLALMGAACLSAEDAYGPPTSYYSSAEGFLGNALKFRLHDIIDGHKVVSYSQATSALRALDATIADESRMHLIYSPITTPIAAGPDSVNWNREHVWPQSYGTDSGAGNSDLHHLFPADATVNSIRSNKIFDYSTGNFDTTDLAPGSSYDANSWEPRDEDKGRIARAVLYMDVRYDGSDATGDLELAERGNSSTRTFAKLSVLLEWNRLFPPDERERRRNDMIFDGFTYGALSFGQSNRNPFVDFPELGDAIFTSDELQSRGSWRIQHFSFNELSQNTFSGPLANPDNDDAPNLVEMALDRNPIEPDPEEDFPTTVYQDNGFTTFTFRRLKNAETTSFLDYNFEISFDPYNPETWEAWNPASFFYQVKDEGITELVSISDPGLVARGQPAIRLVIDSRFPGESPVSVTYDPNLRGSPANSVFRYEPLVAGFRNPGWFTYTYDLLFPWIWSTEHGFQYVTGNHPDRLWLYDPNMGWLFTSQHDYPWLFSASENSWIVYLDGNTPNRQFWNASTGDTFSENPQ